ncbi:MAG: hypothetical protein GF320_11810 [Armatimonadia bacterium]|nr:hypothetical protein [Armatimonadia bacterium]
MTVRLAIVCTLIATLAAGGFAQERTHHRVLDTDPEAAVPVIDGGDLEAELGPRWSGWHAGFEIDDTVARSGQRSARVTRGDDGPEAGIHGEVRFDDEEPPALVIVSGWSRAEDVTGSPDSGYSLYLDVTYQDGTQEWAVNRPFDVGTHDWQQRRIAFRPAKPLSRIDFYGLFRGHVGTAWFDDFQVHSVPTGEATLFDGVPIEAGAAEEGFSARDVGDGSDIIWLGDGGLDLDIEVSTRARAGARIMDVTVTDLRGEGDRAVTVYFTVPVDGEGRTFWETPRRGREIATGEYSHTRPVAAGEVGRVSLYPFACVSDEAGGIALGAPLDSPRLYRFAYSADTEELLAAVDLALCQDYQRLPGGADFSLVVFEFGGPGGMRAALERYYEIFPEHFRVRAEDQGIWMPFAPISQVQDWEDFGFLFKEGSGEPAWDSEHGIETYPYIEPSSNWMPMPDHVPRTHEAALDYLYANREAPRNAATITSGIELAGGEPHLRIEDAPWCDGALFLLSPAPSVPAGGGPTQFELLRQAVEEGVFGAGTEIEGQYVDSLEMGFWEPNYRREHIRASAIPPTFDSRLQPMLLHQWSVFEFTSWLEERIRGAGKKTFANAALWTAPWHAAHFDIMGTETNWGSDDDFRPDSDDVFLYRRAMSGRKPYVLLQNTRYDTFTQESVRRYFDRCLFYGCWPSFFSHNAAEDPYWQNPGLYNRDRAMFLEYIPKIRRITRAGWQSVTGAVSSNERVLIERWGESILTIHNDSAEPQAARIELEDGEAFDVELGPYETVVRG